MNKELAVKLAVGDTLFEKCENANEIFKANSDDWDKPFTLTDLAEVQFFYWCTSNISQRERDLLIVAQSLRSMHFRLSVDVGVFKKELLPHEEEALKTMKDCLQRLGISDFLTYGLQNDVLERYFK